MKSTNHQDPIKQLADRLREHAVPYREGAWEQFKAMEKRKEKKSVVLWPYFSAAAVMLLAITLFWPANENKTIPVEVATISPSRERTVERPDIKREEIAPGGIGTSVASEKPARRVSSRTTVAPQVEPRLAFVTEENNENIRLSRVNTLEGKAASLSFEDQQHRVDEGVETSLPGTAEETLASARVGEDKVVIIAREQKGPTDFLSELLRIEEPKAVLDARTDKKWSVGLNVSPNMSANNQVNMGGGVALAYAVSPKISISSGVSYLQLDAERGVPSTNQYNSPASVEAGAVNININNKTLDKVQANLVGLDIPLTLNYHINKRVFTSVGVSVFSVLNESGSRQYLNQMADVSYGLGDTKTPEPIVRTFYSKEASPEKIYEGKSVSGFFNFSVGYSIPLSKKVGFAIEPFFKIPMGYISPEELNLSNGGVKISTRF